jgi:hypothetical protein
MPIFSKSQIPAQVERTKLEPEIAAWLPTGPVLGAHLPYTYSVAIGLDAAHG